MSNRDARYAVRAENLRRVYRIKLDVLGRKAKTVVAIDNLSFAIHANELFGILGPNGAGKTTTIKILTTLLTPSAGKASILGLDVTANSKVVRSRIGVVFGGERGLYWRLNAFDNLRYFANLYYVPPPVANRRIPELLELVGLTGRGDEKIEGYSRGMKQRLHIARALLHDPEVLFLDEPTIGLDPVGARDIHALIRYMQELGKTIVLTTHYMFEADALCQRIAIVNKGRLVAMDTPTQLKQQVVDQSIVEIELYDIHPDTMLRIRKLEGVKAVTVDHREHVQILQVHTILGARAIAPVIHELEDQALKVSRVTVREPTLEDAYVRLVGGEP